MKIYITIVLLIICNKHVSAQSAQSVQQSEVDTTCFVLSELMAEAKEKGDYESILIYSNVVDKIKRKYTVDQKYVNYFNSIKVSNIDLTNGIVISLNNPPKFPGFTNKEIDNFISLKKEGISLMDFNEFLVLKKLGQGKMKIENINEFELKNLEKLKSEVEGLKLKN